MGVNQQTVSILENSKEINDEKLIEVAKALDVSVEAIKHFSEEAVLNIIGNTYHNSNVINGSAHNCNFNPLDKVIELYERLVLAEKEKVQHLDKLLKGK